MRSKVNIDWLPSDMVAMIQRLRIQEQIMLRIVNPRKSKLGDYRFVPHSKKHVVTVNVNLDPIDFLITFLHEVAHKQCRVEYGLSVAPHGKEWENMFESLLNEALKELNLTFEEQNRLQYFASHTPAKFPIGLDVPEGKLQVKDLNPTQVFKLSDGRKFEVIQKRRTRYLCKELDSGKSYLVAGAAIVEQL